MTQPTTKYPVVSLPPRITTWLQQHVHPTTYLSDDVLDHFIHMVETHGTAYDADEENEDDEEEEEDRPTETEKEKETEKKEETEKGEEKEEPLATVGKRVRRTPPRLSRARKSKSKSTTKTKSKNKHRRNSS